MWVIIAALPGWSAGLEQPTFTVSDVEVQLLLPTDDRGRVVAKRAGDVPRFLISRKRDVLMCDYVSGSAHAQKVWTAWSEFFEAAADAAATAAVTPVEAKPGLLGKTGSADVGWCNATATAKDGAVVVHFVRNRNCDQVPCTTDALDVTLRPSEATQLSRALFAAAERM